MSRGYGRIQRAIIEELRGGGWLTVADLAAACGTSTSNVHRAVRRMGEVRVKRSLGHESGGWPTTFVSEFVQDSGQTHLASRNGGGG